MAAMRRNDEQARTGSQRDGLQGHAAKGSQVPEVGVEPTPPEGDWILSPARLPFRHSGAATRPSNRIGGRGPADCGNLGRQQPIRPTARKFAPAYAKKLVCLPNAQHASHPLPGCRGYCPRSLRVSARASRVSPRWRNHQYVMCSKISLSTSPPACAGGSLILSTTSLRWLNYFNRNETHSASD